jgi:hypothetical protein
MFPKTIPPDELPFHPVLSIPLIFTWTRVKVLGYIGLSRIWGMVRWHDVNHGQTIEDENSAAHPKENT